MIASTLSPRCRAAPCVRRRCEADLRSEIAGEVSLIVVSELLGRSGQVDPFTARHPFGSLLDARSAYYPLGCDADMAFEQTMERAHGDAGRARQIFGARDGPVFLSQPDQAIGQRHLLGAHGGEASQEGLYLAANRVGIQVAWHSQGSSRNGFDRGDLVDEVAHGRLRKRKEA